MKKRLNAALLCAAMILTMIPLTIITATADAETLIYSCTFSNEAVESHYWAPNGGAAEIEWIDRAGAGHGDNTALKVVNNGTTYNSAENAIRLTLPEPLVPGGTYRVVAWVYAALDENPNKTVLTGPGFVINGDYPGAQGVVKFPPAFGTLPFDEWKAIDVTLPMFTYAINTLDFRLVINDAPNHPDVWYWDGIEIYLIGEIEEIRIPKWNMELPSLAEAYKDLFPIGNATDNYRIQNPEFEEMFKRYYNAVTAENSMKPLYLAPAKGDYRFTGADPFVDWANENGISVHGHTLLWHQQSPDWLTNAEDGSVLTRAEAKANMEEFINNVAGHFVGRVFSWDVVNEALDNNGGIGGSWKSGLRTSAPWYRAYNNGLDAAAGEHASDYIYDAFVFTRLADPNAVLYYTDFNEENADKRDSMANMAREFNTRWLDDPRNTDPERLLVEGIGMQAHYWTDPLNPSDVRDSIRRFINTGLRVSILELDIPFGSYGTYQSRTQPPNDAELAKQAMLYGSLFEIFVNHAEHIDRVTFWGLADDMSWRSAGYPLIFDEYYDPKPAFWSVLGVIDPETVAEWLVTDEPEPDETPEQPTEAPPPVTDAPTAPPPPATDPPLPAAPPPDDTGGSTWWIVVLIIAALAAAGAGTFLFIRKKSGK